MLVAVSGGQDSLCLLKLLHDLQPQWDWHLGVAYCNHRWREDTSDADLVQATAHAWNLPFYLKVAAQVDKTEAGAREWRYQALAEIAQAQNFDCVVTGHTASDRAETLLYNLVRGSGSDGLQALTWKRPLTPTVDLVRPLLTVTRAETARFCQEMHLTFWEDPSNQDLKYARNRIRQELLPYLCQHFNPQAENTLAQTVEILQAEVDYLEAETVRLLKQVLHSDQCKINRFILRRSPLALQRRVLRKFLQANLTCSPNFDHIEKLVELINAPNRSQTDPFPGGAIAVVAGEWILLSSEELRVKNEE